MAFYPYFYFISPYDGEENVQIDLNQIATFCLLFTTPTFDFGTQVATNPILISKLCFISTKDEYL